MVHRRKSRVRKANALTEDQAAEQPLLPGALNMEMSPILPKLRKLDTHRFPTPGIQEGIDMWLSPTSSKSLTRDLQTACYFSKTNPTSITTTTVSSKLSCQAISVLAFSVLEPATYI